jgi:peroxiredoxin
VALLNTPDVSFGWQAVDFELKDPGGNAHSMTETLTQKGLMIAFLCNHCPYVQAIADRLASDFAELQKAGIGVLAVMSNNYHISPCDAPEHMANFAQKNGWTFPYLVDEDQSVGETYGAVCTPDFFGFNGDGQLQYRGRLDSAAMGRADGRRKELVEAMLQIASTGQGPKDQVPSMGCSIKWT